MKKYILVSISTLAVLGSSLSYIQAAPLGAPSQQTMQRLERENQRQHQLDRDMKRTRGQQIQQVKQQQVKQQQEEAFQTSQDQIDAQGKKQEKYQRRADQAGRFKTKIGLKKYYQEKASKAGKEKEDLEAIAEQEKCNAAIDSIINNPAQGKCH